jgi:DNA-binding transcriptional LysR family regulator
MKKPQSELPNVRHLAAAIAVLQQRSISAAARTVHLTQPAVTQAMNTLEQSVGGRLFDRSPQGVRPTDIGQRTGVRLERALEHVSIGLLEAGASSTSTELAALARSVTATQLRAVSEVVAAGGIAAAARTAGTTRATLHRPLRQLEGLLGIPLLEATSHGIRPTRAAGRLARRVRLAESEWQQACAEMAAASGDEKGATVIGAMPLARSVIVPATVLAFAQQFPRHRVEVLDGPYESMLEALRDGRADWLIGALREVVTADVVQEALFDDPLAIIARAQHPLAIGQEISAADLSAQSWVAPRSGSPLRRRFDQLIGARGAVEPIECNSLMAARSILLASDRLMLSSTHQVRHELNTGVLAVVHHPFGRLTRTIGITRRRDWDPTPTQRVMLDLLVMESRRVAQESLDADGSNPSRLRTSRGARPVPRVTKREK